MRQKATAAEPREAVQQALRRSLPTPVRRLFPATPGRAEIWLKDDGVSAPLYGGNKVRKLAPLLARAEALGKRRIVTLGAAGSHHVLATSVYAAAAGFTTLAFLTPQPNSEHARMTLRCALGAGLQAIPVRRIRDAMLALRELAAGDFLVAPGGMGALGASGYFDAAAELALQVEQGVLAQPEWIVLPAGSGSTAAGLLAGLCAGPLRSRILAVAAAPNPAIRPIVLSQALAVARLRGANLSLSQLSARIDFEHGHVGKGYGHATAAGVRAAQEGENCGLSLDPTYTAKAFAAALELRARVPGQHILFWQTLSAAPLAPLLAVAPQFEELPRDLANLLINDSALGLHEAS
jgi:D-cysteine desulfhydrase